MAITTTATATDPYGPLAWAIALVVLALKKLLLAASLENAQKASLNVDLSLDEDELEALDIVADEFNLLSEARRISVNDLFVGKNMPLRSDLRDGFSTLVAIEKEISPPMNRVDFKKTEEELREIKKNVESAKIDSLKIEVLEDAQKVCLDLLEHINQQRPSISLH